jgi:predicted MFS family arabinose efflux permease
MQWRSLILLVSGLAVIYIAILLQDTPYLHPKSVYSSSNHPLIMKTDHVIITTVGAFVYLTSIQYEKTEAKDTVIGTGKLKLGVKGTIGYFCPRSFS